MADKPPGWWYHAAVVITVLVVAWWESIPFGYSEAGVLVIFVLVPLMSYWAVRLALALTRDVAAVRRRLLGWLASPVIVGGLWLAVDADLPFKARFALSQAGMEHFARNVLDGGAQDVPVCAGAGLFPVCGHVVGEDGKAPIGVELQINDWPIMGSRCFVWAPHGRPRAEDYETGSGTWPARGGAADSGTAGNRSPPPPTGAADRRRGTVRGG